MTKGKRDYSDDESDDEDQTSFASGFFAVRSVDDILAEDSEDSEDSEGSADDVDTPETISANIVTVVTEPSSSTSQNNTTNNVIINEQIDVSSTVNDVAPSMLLDEVRIISPETQLECSASQDGGRSVHTYYTTEGDDALCGDGEIKKYEEKEKTSWEPLGIHSSSCHLFRQFLRPALSN